jgi:hypothetical protein
MADSREKEITFCPDPRHYLVRNREVKLSVTALVGAMWREVSVPRLIGNMRKRGTLAERYPGMTARDIARQWDRTASEACRLGTLMHEAIHCRLSGVPLKRDTSEVAVELEMATQFVADEIETKGRTVYRTEMPIFYDDPASSDIVIPGSVDLLVTDTDGGIILYDWKRSQKIDESYECSDVLPWLTGSKMNKFSLQASLYAVILRKCYRMNVKAMYLVVLHADNSSYLLVPAADMTDIAERELIGRYNFYRTRAEENKRVRDQNKKMLR